MNDIPDPESQRADTRRGVLRWVRRETMGIVLVIVTLFPAAGRWDWLMGWALVGLYVLWTGATALIAIPRHPQMLAERARGRMEGAKKWDAVILSVVGLLTLAKHLVAGFDQRFGWSPALPVGVQIAALVLAALAYALVTWAMAANAFFSCVVRIQDDRDHAVVSSGPYRIVRHPGYLGTFVFELVTPLMLGSLWALIAGGLAALLTLVRTVLEDKTLREELAGYEEYARQVCNRLLPGVW